jgi:hypothetical protein
MISIQDDLSYNIPRLRLIIEDIEYLEALRVQEYLREQELIRQEEQRTIREARERQRLLEEQAGIRRRQYFAALRYIFLLALLFVATALAGWLAWQRSKRFPRLPKHLSAKPVTKSHRTVALPDKTRR